MDGANRLPGLLNEIEEIFAGDAAVLRVAVFGSIARGTQDKWSDIDLIVVAPGNMHFRNIFKTLQQARSILYHAPFEAKPEPIGSHILGIVLSDEHPFHCIDLNFLSVEDYQGETLHRFGALQERFSRTSLPLPVNSPTDEPFFFEPAPIDRLDREIGTVLHFTKKTTKNYLRGQGTLEEARNWVEKLRATMSSYPLDIRVPNGQIGYLAQLYLEICDSVLIK